VLPVVDDAEGHHAVERCDLFHLDLFLVVFHCCEGFVRRRSDSLAIYSRTSSSLPLGLTNVGFSSFNPTAKIGQKKAPEATPMLN
jgi:hypothetical protein